MENNFNKKPSEESISDADLLISHRELTALKKKIEELKDQGLLQTTLETLKEELTNLKTKKEELQNQIYSYEADDMTNLHIELDHIEQNIIKKTKELNELSYDPEILGATIQDVDEKIEKRSRLN